MIGPEPDKMIKLGPLNATTSLGQFQNLEK